MRGSRPTFILLAMDDIAGMWENVMSTEPLEISSEPAAPAEETAVIRNGVYRFNFDATGILEYRDVALFVRDHAGTIKGGLLGYVWAGWLHVTDLWLTAECRGRGLGSQLLVRAEQEAQAFGAGGAFLSTFD